MAQTRNETGAIYSYIETESRDSSDLRPCFVAYDVCEWNKLCVFHAPLELLLFCICSCIGMKKSSKCSTNWVEIRNSDF